MQYGTELLLGASVIPVGQAHRLMVLPVTIVQMLLLQAPVVLHVFPVGHLLHDAPPQSMSVSSWFFTPSLHVGDSHTHAPASRVPASPILSVHAVPLKP